MMAARSKAVPALSVRAQMPLVPKRHPSRPGRPCYGASLVVRRSEVAGRSPRRSRFGLRRLVAAFRKRTCPRFAGEHSEEARSKGGRAPRGGTLTPGDKSPHAKAGTSSSSPRRLRRRDHPATPLPRTTNACPNYFSATISPLRAPAALAKKEAPDAVRHQALLAGCKWRSGRGSNPRPPP